MRAAHYKCGSLPVNTRKLICMLKNNISTDLYCQKQPLKMINAM